ncbi:amino acid adenylation domain-containing protein [Streptacidiphilus jiangxiensis]|uniref:Nonribosomal peptide synthetase DhbF n=1 Tax=Streptacidiphilus jiangxiensis TaxID=235985 RepID=A0A1H7Y3L3_STRJI|nr:amino acid adenylation domain-containing protein [Streptacidiphilus jiangxiensis]SEM40515.1 nonribosomal peptide synthetase DhbF [Streptacidiphilus jiangxiensis]
MNPPAVTVDRHRSAEPVEVPAVGSLWELFESSRAAHGSRTAVTGPEGDLSYDLLHARAERLAAHLTARGVGKGSLVGLLLPRSVDIPVAILAVLRTGAAYVPLDPDYPPDRLAYLAEDSGVRLVVGDPELVRRCGLDTVEVCDPWRLPPDGSGSEAPDPAPHAPRPDDPAYVIYTSGSTGDPKGCVITHGNVLALLRHTLPLLDIGPADRWTLFHSYNFDFSVWELWGPLATGGTAVVVPGEQARSPHGLLDLVLSERVTVLNQVPSVFRYLQACLAETDPVALPLRYVIFGGESVDLDVVRDFLAARPAPGPVMVNMYGITEITVHATFKELPPEALAGAVRSPIGRPLPHLAIALLGEDGSPVPDGETGEMWVLGDGVAQGYLGREELTSQRFRTLPTPSGPRRGYRTGDLARRLPDGELEYLGRNDEQVKLRGFRIELGEIETALRAHPSVRDAAAVVVTNRKGRQSLVACCVPAAVSNGTELQEELALHLARTLPGYMVPDRFVLVAALPLTPSGKLDRHGVREAAALRPRRDPPT